MTKMTKEELEAMGIFGVESENDLVSKPEKNNKVAENHHGMMSGSSIGLVIIEPASEEDIAKAKQRLFDSLFALVGKGLAGSDNDGNLIIKCTFEEACAKRAKSLFEEYEVAERALKRLQNTDFGETAKSYSGKIVSQRRRVFNAARPREFSGNAMTEWGNGKESEAIAAFESLTGLKLEKTGDKQEFVRLGYVESVDFDFSDWFGCTPDSITKGIPREFKNPASGVVFDRYRKLKTPADLKKENPLYYWQCIAQMACLNAPYMQWIAYDCDVINPADRFVIIDFERDTEVEQVLINSIFKAVQYIKNELE